MPLDHSPISRRTVAKGAAWSVPAVAVAASAPALAASPTCEPKYTTVTKTFQFTDIVGQPATVEVTASNVPLEAPNGSEVVAIDISTTTTLSKISSGALPGLLGGATKVDGTVASPTELSGVVTDTVDASLTIPTTELTNPVVITADGSSPAMTVTATGTGTVTITLGAPVPTLTGYDDAGEVTGGPQELALTKIDGNDYVLATFQVTDEC